MIRPTQNFSSSTVFPCYTLSREESKLTQTINNLSFEKILLLAREARKRTLRKHKYPLQSKTALKNDFRLLSRITLMVKNNRLSPLIGSAFSAVKFALDYQLSLHDLINLVCLLNVFRFTKEYSDNEIFFQISERMEEIVAYNRFLDFEAAMGIFSLRKVKAINLDLIKGFCEKIDNSMFLDADDISLTVTGIAAMNYRNPTLMREFRLTATSKLFLQNITSNQAFSMIKSYIDASDLVDSNSLIGRKANQELASACTKKLTANMNNLSVKRVIQIAIILKFLNFTNQDFFNAVKKRINEEPSKIQPDDIVTLIKIFSETGGNNDSVLLSLLKSVQDKFQEFNVPEICSLTYSVLIKFCFQDENFFLYEKFIRQAIEYMASTHHFWTDSELQKLETITTIFQGLAKRKLDENLKDHLQVVFKDFFQPQTPSRFHMDIVNHLKPILVDNIQMEIEHNFACNFSLDIAFLDIKLAIEADGDFHFDEQRNYLPKNILKETLLDLKGWSLVRIDQNEWGKKNNAGKRALLVEKLLKFEILKEKNERKKIPFPHDEFDYPEKKIIASEQIQSSKRFVRCAS